MGKTSNNKWEIMKTIEIEDDLYKYILNNIEAFGETPSQILRRLLVLTEEKSKKTQNETAENKELNLVKVELSPIVDVKKEQVIKKATAESTPAPINVVAEEKSNTHFCDGVDQLFKDPAFISESVITNKFMMMLTTMYLEKTDAFVESADKIKGRTRAYLGTHLQDLLNSDNEEELTQFKASKPRAIPQAPFWVITNANTGRKRIILTQMMASMGYPHSLIERIKEEI